jgi:hypothetical protein
MDETTTTDKGRFDVNRRTLLKAGAHTAWAVPAVQLLSSVPAMAATGCNLQVTAQWVSSTNTLQLQVKNTGSTAVKNLIVTVGFSIGNPKYVTHVSKAEWAYASDKKTFSFTHVGDLGPGQTASLSITFSNVSHGKPGAAEGDAYGSVSGSGGSCQAAFSVKTRA